MELIRIIFAWSVYLIIKALWNLFLFAFFVILAGISLFCFLFTFFGFIFGPIVGFIWLFVSGSLFEIVSDVLGGFWACLGSIFETSNQKINLFFTETEEVSS